MSDQPFVHRHVVKWGECDPAGIVYTPQVLHFTIEAMEGWMRFVLDTHWLQNIRERGIGSPMVATALRFLRPMPPETRLEITVYLNAVGSTSLDIGFIGRDVAQEVMFLSRVATAFIDAASYRTIPIPDDIRVRAEAYMASVGQPPLDLPPLR